MNDHSDRIVASIRQRLLNISRARTEDFLLILTQYAIERILYRISQSRYKDRFVLKGAQLFRVWSGYNYRPTRDLDLLGSGDNSEGELRQVFTQIWKFEGVHDGLHFDPDSISVLNIRDDQEYGGQRIKLRGYLGRAKIDLQIDIGFGDIITPGPVIIHYPSLLDMAEPEILTYTPETVIAEILQAMVDLGFQNSRMKDFYDVFVLSNHFKFTGNLLVSAIRRTFRRRQTSIPESDPLPFSLEFSSDSQKITQWSSFLRKNKLENAPQSFEHTVNHIRLFLSDPLRAASGNHEFNKFWNPAGPWIKRIVSN